MAFVGRVAFVGTTALAGALVTTGLGAVVFGTDANPCADDVTRGVATFDTVTEADVTTTDDDAADDDDDDDDDVEAGAVLPAGAGEGGVAHEANATADRTGITIERSRTHRLSPLASSLSVDST